MPHHGKHVFVYSFLNRLCSKCGRAGESNLKQSFKGTFNEGRPAYVLSHHHLHLVLNLRPNGSADAAGQLIRVPLEAVHHLLELSDHGVPGLLLPLLSALHVNLKLLDVCRPEIGELIMSTHLFDLLLSSKGIWGGKGTTSLLILT